ncbi:MAG: hypothetical protein R6U20_03105 [Longimonas sp.]|uniref:hypothetical protein n=1 Tax=Longimonas sp. TaxID=2039626 RepID=UPI003975C10D
MKTVPPTPIAAFRMAKSAGEGITVHVTRSSAEVGPPVPDWHAIGEALALEPMPAPHASDADIHIKLAPALPPRPEAATRVSRDERGTVWRHASGWHIERATYTARLAPTNPVATLAMATAPASEEGTARWAHAFRDVLTLLLPRTGWMPLHAAALRAPAGSTGPNALLLVGPSGCGKSTLTAGLMMRAWAGVSDDMLVVPPPATTSVHVHSLAQTIHVCTDAWDRLDLPAPTSINPPRSLFGRFTEREKRPMHPRMRPRHHSPDPAPTMRRAAQAAPAALLLPTITDRKRSELVACSATQALPELMAQGVPPALLPPDAARAQWDRMGHLLRQCTVYRLHAGRDLYHDPGRLAELLQTTTALV